MDRFQSEPYAAYRHTDESPDFAANVCENCDRGSSSPLHYVPEYKMNACDVCYDEAMAILAKEAAQERAAAAKANAAQMAVWRAMENARRDSLGDRIIGSRRCANCAGESRPDSIYCSDACRTQFLNFSEAA